MDYGLNIYETFVGDTIHIKAYLPEIAFFSWSPDGTQIAALRYKVTSSPDSYLFETDSWVTLIDANTLEETAKFSDSEHNSSGPVLWAPIEQRIAVLRGEHIDIINPETSLLLEQFPLRFYNFNAAWSPFGGRLAIAGPSDQASAITDIQIVVPAPSLDLLTSIAATCAPETNLPSTDDLTAYIDIINADPAIPPACAADLLAVAEALQAEQTGSP
jgi:hypothetical protein